MAYYGDRAGGYPLGPEFVEDALGGIGRGGYGVSSYEYERGRPLGGEYINGPPEYYGAERPGLGREGYGREGYAPSSHDQGYPYRPLVPPPVDYIDAEPSDLGMGLRDAGKVASTEYGAGYMRPGYDAGYMRPERAGYGGAPGYGGAAPSYGGAPGYGGVAPGYGGAEDEVRQLRKELEHERRKKHELELATGAAVGYGLHERHEKDEDEDEEDDDDDDDDGDDRKKGKKHHRLLQKLGL